MSKIISIGTAVPAFKHAQKDILNFMQQVYALDAVENRKLKFLYSQSQIETRYSVVPDYSHQMDEWKFYPHSENLEPFPNIEKRMTWYNRFAPTLSVDAIRNCIEDKIHGTEITHLITVSCTGMSAPGLDLMVMDMMDLPKNIFRTSINFMGCYAAIHGLKMADAICKTEKNAKVMIVCTELCTLHFQKDPSPDNIASTLLFADGSAAVLVVHDEDEQEGVHLKSFYSEIIPKGKRDMAWELSSTGFLMTLSGYIPDLIEEDFEPLVRRALTFAGVSKDQIGSWCIHPGGRRIVDSIHKSLQLEAGESDASYKVLKEYGNMSSPTILFVLKELMDSKKLSDNKPVFGAAFGPGLTMETFVASAHA